MEEERKRKEEEERKKRVEEERKKRVEEERKKRVEEERKKRVEEERKRKEEEERRKREENQRKSLSNSRRISSDSTEYKPTLPANRRITTLLEESYAPIHSTPAPTPKPSSRPSAVFNQSPYASYDNPSQVEKTKPISTTAQTNTLLAETKRVWDLPNDELPRYPYEMLIVSLKTDLVVISRQDHSRMMWMSEEENITSLILTSREYLICRGHNMRVFHSGKEHSFVKPTSYSNQRIMY